MGIFYKKYRYRLNVKITQQIKLQSVIGEKHLKSVGAVAVSDVDAGNVAPNSVAVCAGTV